MSQQVMRNVVLEMYELDMRVDERVPNYLLRMVDLLFLSKRAKAQAPFATIENFAKFCETYPEFIKHALNLQSEVILICLIKKTVFVLLSCEILLPVVPVGNGFSRADTVMKLNQQKECNR